MQTTLLAVGKLRPCYREACDDYLQRLRHYSPVTEVELREAPRAKTPALRRREETARLLRAAPQGSRLVVLDQNGNAWSSEALAARVGRWRDEGSAPALVIGGAFGLEADLLAGTAERWSLGPLTLPHELARVIVLEQWYRAWTILKGEPYHKGGER